MYRFGNHNKAIKYKGLLEDHNTFLLANRTLRLRERIFK